MKFKTFSPKKSKEEGVKFEFDCGKSDTVFYLHRTLDSLPL